LYSVGEQAASQGELKTRPRPSFCAEQPVDLPLGQQPPVAVARFRPVDEPREALQATRDARALLDGPVQALLTQRNVEAGLTESVRERPEGLPVQRFGRHRPAVFAQIPAGRQAPDLVAQSAKTV
jgi:hypothetical protein